MKNLLIGVYSCDANVNRVVEIERLKMFHNTNQVYILTNHDSLTLPNSIQLGVNPGYENLIYKTVKFLEYFLTTPYEYCLKCDDDSFVDVKRLSLFDYTKFDYSGFFINTSINRNLDYFKEADKGGISQFKDSCKYQFAVGGGYIVSRRAAQHVVETFRTSFEYQRHILTGMGGCEDRMVGQLLKDDFTQFNHGKVYNQDTMFYSVLFDSIYHSVDVNLFKSIKHRSLSHYTIGKWIENNFI